MKTEKNSNNNEIIPKKRVMILAFRWVALSTVIISFFNAPEDYKINKAYIMFLLAIILYNISVCYFSLKTSSKEKINSKPIILFDIFFVSIFACQWGGVSTDVYVLYFFVIAYCSIYSKSYTVKIGLIIILSYSFACFVYAKNNNIGDYILSLLIRDSYIFITCIAVIFINSEVKKYDEMHRKEFKMARTDKLTGLANRHYFEQKLLEEVEYSNTTGNPLNILLFDLDDFKQFNDTFGHVWGDKLLILFSDIIKQSIRKSDIPVRFGGEEFLIMIRDLDFDTALSVGNRIKIQLERQRLYTGYDENRKRATVSCGIAQYPYHSKNIKEVIEFADKALYQAKELGKNRIVPYDDLIEKL